MGAQTQHKARPQVGRPNATATHVRKQMQGHVRKLGVSPTQGTRHVRKLGAQTQRKARPQDGRPNEKLIRNENVHTREH
jgi:hypothetical protein